MIRFAMLFNVSGLMQEGIGATRTYGVQGTLHSEERPPEPVKGEVELMRTPAGILVRARIRLVEPELCSRCLHHRPEPHARPNGSSKAVSRSIRYYAAVVPSGLSGTLPSVRSGPEHRRLRLQHSTRRQPLGRPRRPASKDRREGIDSAPTAKE